MGKSQETPHLLTAEEKRSLLASLLRTRAGGEESVAPLSYSQRAMWFLYQLSPSSSAYNTAFAARIVSPLNVQALEQALRQIVERHGALRTTFVSGMGEPVQRICRDGSFHLDQVNASAWQEERLQREISEEYGRPFDLEQGPLFRATLFTRAEQDHVLLLAVHHIVFDAWSFWIVLRELGSLYQSAVNGVPSQLPPVTAAPHAHRRWQDRLLESAEGEALWSYWKSKLDGGLPFLALPTDFPRPQVQTYNGSAYRFLIDAGRTEALRALAGSASVTIFVALLATFKVLLHRFTSQDDIIVGTPTSGRSRPEFESIVGDFINMMPLRTRVTGAQSFRGLLSAVRDVVLEGLEHQDLPFPVVVRRLGLHRDPSRSPVFQAAFLFHRTQGGADLAPLFEYDNTTVAVNVGGIMLLPVHLEQQTGQFDVALEITEVREHLECSMKFNTDLFLPATAERMGRSFLALLEAVTEEPDRAVCELNLVHAADRRFLLHEWNPRQSQSPGGGCLYDFVRDQSAKTPTARAVVAGDQTLTYAELVGRAEEVARALQDEGIGPGTRVGVCLDRSPDLVAVLLGIMQAGASYLPLDPDYPPARIAFIMEDSEASAVVLERKWKDRFQFTHVRILIREELGSRTATGVLPTVDPEAEAYLLYTSGSTGQPKGVRISHASLASFLLAMADRPGISADDVLLAVTTLSFDIAGLELYLPLIAGATIILASKEEASDPLRLAGLLSSERVTVMQATPATWRILLSAGWTGKQDLKILCGGEAMAFDLARALCARGKSVWNLYGPTETTVWSTVWKVDLSRDRVAIGRPLANTSCYVTDSSLRLVPRGVTGELCIGGAGVALGYLKRPELTGDRFHEDPFSSRREARLYRTGDLVRLASDGELEYLGRLDTQVKVRGFRLELEELEVMLRRCDGVADAVVATREDVTGEQELLAFVVLHTGSVLRQADLKETLRASLPAFMIPSSIFQVESFPQTTSGKVDRRTLVQTSSVLDRELALSALPRTPVETTLAEIWREVLRRAAIGIHEDFFEQGGHSLLATQVMSRLRQVFQRDFPLRLIFEAPTIASLASRIQSAITESRTIRAVPSIERLVEQGSFPLSFAQERMWFLQQLSPETTAYNIPACSRLRGTLDRAALKRALTALVARHESLRTTFIAVDGVPRQIIHQPAEVALDEVPLDGVPPAERETHALLWLVERARQVYRLDKEPLFRAAIAELTPEDHLLLLDSHHSVSDQWSYGVIGRDLAAFYNACRQGRTPSLSPLRVQYADFSAWQRDLFGGGYLEDQLAYWRNALKGIPETTTVPADRHRPPVQTSAGGTRVLGFPEMLLRELSSVSAREGTTVFMTLLAGFVALLQRYTGQDDIAIGVPVANRHYFDVEPIVGSFVNTLVIRADLSGKPSVRELLARVRKMTLEAYTNQDVPFERLVTEIQAVRNLSHGPLVQVLFNGQNAPMKDIAFDGLVWEPVFLDRGSAQFDISVSVDVELTGTVCIEYNADLYAPATVDRLLRHYLKLLAAFAQDTTQPVISIPLFTPAERDEVLGQWNATSTDIAVARCVHEWISDTARRMPSAVAIRAEEGSLSYEDLIARANRCAALLRLRGAGRGSIVGLALERSIDAVVWLLGILKSGAAYLPLDPGYPEGRLTFMVQDSGVRWIVTDLDHAGLFRECLAEIIPIENIDAELERCAGTDHEGWANPDDRAYVIYTSGSTGKPKGVEIEHGSLINFLSSMQREPGIGSADILLSVTTLSFDIAALEIFLPLVSGATVWLVSRETAIDGRALRKAIETSGATVMQATPVTWEMLIQSGWEGTPGLKVLCGGEALSPDLVNDLLRRTRELWNMYGPTETTIWSTIERVQDSTPPISIGRPIANTRIYVLDAGLQPVPIGVPGGLYIGGAGVARGYLGRPELTAERFLTNPFGPGRIYWTGDVARWLPDGRLECLGRQDHQVKIRGHRIELGEIEVLLRDVEGVKECVVLAREDTAGDRRLVSYIVPREGSFVDPLALRRYLKERVAEFMIPAAFIELKHLPLTPNGKIDRTSLPRPAPSAMQGQGASTAPRTTTERQLASIWCNVLGVPEVGVDQSFFDLGGHSLLAVRLFSEIERLTGKRLPLATLFQAPTIEHLARLIGDQGWSPTWSSLVPINAGGSKPPFFGVHGIGGNVLEFYELAAYLGPDQPVYGIQAQGLDGKRPMHSSVEEMAAHYVREIQELQPHGPYYIGGSSFGGLVAYEMAQQIRAKGEVMGLLALFDTNAPGYPRYLPTTTALKRSLYSWRFRIELHWSNLWASRGMARVQYIREKIRRLTRAQRMKLERKYRRLLRRVKEFFLPKAIKNVQKAGQRAQAIYAPSPYDGTVTLFRALSQPYGIFADRTNGWDQYAKGEIVIREVPGHHGAIMRAPRVKVLAGLLEQELKEAVAKQRWPDSMLDKREGDTDAKEPWTIPFRLAGQEFHSELGRESG